METADCCSIRSVLAISSHTFVHVQMFRLLHKRCDMAIMVPRFRILRSFSDRSIVSPSACIFLGQCCALLVQSPTMLVGLVGTNGRAIISSGQLSSRRDRWHFSQFQSKAACRHTDPGSCPDVQIRGTSSAAFFAAMLTGAVRVSLVFAARVQRFARTCVS